MQRYNIITGTVTHAIKGRDILLQNGYSKVRVERTAKGIGAYGCGYGIVIDTDNIANAELLLRSNSVKILKIV